MVTPATGATTIHGGMVITTVIHTTGVLDGVTTDIMAMATHTTTITTAVTTTQDHTITVTEISLRTTTATLTTATTC